MDEENWRLSTRPEPMLEAIRTRRAGRKARLFAIACCQTLEPILAPEAVELLQACEAYADGLLTKNELATYREAAKRPNMANQGALYLRGRGGQAASRGAIAAAWEKAGGPGQALDLCGEARRYSNYRHAQLEFVDLFRCIFGNPFRPVAFDPRWRSADTIGVARAIYEDRAFDRLPLLADALMDAGCDDEQVLGHCRSDGPHVRGCWVVDMVLGKE